MGQKVIGLDDSNDNLAAVNSDPTDDDNLEKWMPFFENRREKNAVDL